MKILSIQLVLPGTFLTLMLLPIAGRAAAPAVVPAGAPKSVFINQAGFGKDPFYPNSTRLQPKVPVNVPDMAPVKTGVPSWVQLNGISILKDRKLAIINNRTVEEGEEFLIKYNGQQIKAKCLEIKESIVVVSVNGATKELELRPGL